LDPEFYLVLNVVFNEVFILIIVIVNQNFELLLSIISFSLIKTSLQSSAHL